MPHTVIDDFFIQIFGRLQTVNVDIKRIHSVDIVPIGIKIYSLYILNKIFVYKKSSIIYSDVSLADGWTFYKRTNWASRKNIKYGLGGFSLYHLNWSIVNTDQESTYECKCFADDRFIVYIFWIKSLYTKNRQFPYEAFASFASM
jgi:hypothetical protein